MEFCITKNYNNTWDISPVSGPLAGEVIAVADGLNLAGARFTQREIVATIKAAWGISIMYEDFDIDVQTLRGLGVGKCFDMRPDQEVVPDSDGFKDKFTLRILQGAKRVMILGATICTMGQY